MKKQNEYEAVSHDFDPVFDEKFPSFDLGNISLCEIKGTSFLLWGIPQNRFWKVIARLTDSEVPQSIAEKKLLLLQHGIAIWDVIESCEIIGSSDSSIRNVVAADLSWLLSQCEIRKIYANGRYGKEVI